MQEPEFMLSNKDIMYISDILMIQYTYIKKLIHYEQLIEDETIKDHIVKVQKELIKGYDTLMEVLNG